jgi:hypothetical protein
MNAAERQGIAITMERVLRAGRQSNGRPFITGTPFPDIIDACWQTSDGEWLYRGEPVPGNQMALDAIQDIGPVGMGRFLAQGVTPAMIEQCRFNLHPVDESGTTLDIGEILGAAQARRAR